MPRQGRVALIAVTVGALAFSGSQVLGFSGSRVPTRRAVPDHLLFMVFDQMRPDYIDRFGLENFKRLRASSRHYPDAYVGHLASQTVVAHMVMPTGLPPRALPWVEDAFVDEAGTLGKPGAAYKTGELGREQTWKLLQGIPRTQFLPARLIDALGEKVGGVFAVGQKDYAANLLGGPHASSIVTLAKPQDGATECTPTGVNVPDYIASNRRFAIDCSESQTYGTGFNTVYKIDGNRYVPGKDPAHLGGDIWTADAAIEIMRRDRWSGLLLTFGGIDKIAHMLGEQDGGGLESVPSEYHLADILRIADQQLGRLLAALDEQGLANRTLVVVTSDHGGQENTFYMGNNGSQSCCPFEGSKASVTPPYWVAHVNAVAGGKLKTAYASTTLTVWLADRSASTEQSAIRGLKDIPGITEIYARRQTGSSYRYDQVHANFRSTTAQFQSWAKRHSAELLDTMAGPAGPDVVGLLADGYGFGRIGDHGGAQERVQRIPLFMRVPGEPPARRKEQIRQMDLAPEITKILALRPAPVATPPAR
jgi:hypothetical protein